jgi:phage shock protein PspC (stress-responsive transcriptional regulator)
MNSQPQPKRLYRSNDRVIAGVCSGLARYFNIDPIIVRVAAVAGLLAGGVTLVAYIAALILVPVEPGEGEPAPPPPARSTGATVAILVAACIAWPIVVGGGFIVAGVVAPFAFLAIAGIVAWWAVSGDGPGGEPRDVARRAGLGLAVLFGCSVLFLAGGWAAATGSGALAAGLVIGAGVLLVIGAFTRTVRWIALPATALALGVGIVSAADLDLTDGIGEREYTPATANDLRDRYELGIGQLVVDLRNSSIPAGDTPLKVRVGVGQALVLVPRDVCVTSTADVGGGHVDVLGREGDGVNVDFEDARRARTGGKRLVLDADVGFGEVAVRHQPYRSEFQHGSGLDENDRSQPLGNQACAGGDA